MARPGVPVEAFPTPVWGSRARGKSARSRFWSSCHSSSYRSGVAFPDQQSLSRCSLLLSTRRSRTALNLIADNGKAPPNRGTAAANQESGLTIGHACLGRLTPFATSLTSLVCSSIDYLPWGERISHANRESACIHDHRRVRSRAC